MGFRFQRRIRLLPGVSINLSKSGVSTSIGTRGAHITVVNGKVRETVGLPGTGLSYTASRPTRKVPAWLAGVAILAVVLLVALASGSAKASFATAGDYLPRCAKMVRVLDEGPSTRMSSEDLADAAGCSSYLTGFIGALRVGQPVEPHSPTLYDCVPPQAQVGQLVRILDRYLKLHPERLHEPMEDVTATALREAFRCQ